MKSVFRTAAAMQKLIFLSAHATHTKRRLFELTVHCTASAVVELMLHSRLKDVLCIRVPRRIDSCKAFMSCVGSRIMQTLDSTAVPITTVNTDGPGCWSTVIVHEGSIIGVVAQVVRVPHAA